MREYQVRFCERLGVKFLGPTLQSRRFGRSGSMSAVAPLATVIANHRAVTKGQDPTSATISTNKNARRKPRRAQGLR